VATKSPGPSRPPNHAPNAALRSSRSPWLTLALLAAVTCAAFAGVLRDGWTLFDDPRYVFDNPHVNHGWRLDQALWFLSHPHGENWHPLTSWSHMLDVQWFGLAPAGHHAMSLLFHALNAVLLAWVLFRLTDAWWRSVLVAALFALHPLRVESVAWIAERKDVLSGLFFLLALEAYRRWAARPGRARATLLIVTFALGLMSKPMLVTLPFLLVLLDVWPLGRLKGLARNPAFRAPARPLQGLIAEKWPLFTLSIASAVITLFVQRRGGAVVSAGLVTPARRISNALITYWRYVEKTFWPHDLAVFYPYRLAFDAAVVAVAAAGLMGVTAVFLWQARRRPYLAVGWLWYLGMLVPVIGLIQVGSQSYADRYTYLPTIGLLVALVWFVGELVADSRPGRAVATGAFALALAGLSVVTVRQVPVWKDTSTLFSHALAVTGENPVAHEKLGEALLEQGKIPQAIAHLEAALRILPTYADAHNNLGGILGMQGRSEEALAHFRAAQLGMNTADEAAQLHHNLAFTLAKLGRVDEALAELPLDPDPYLTLVMLGKVLGSRGRFAEAEPHLRHALELDPTDLETRRLLAVTVLQEGRIRDALATYREILRRSPDDLDALNNVAWIRATCADARLRDGAEAVRLAERARDRSPEPQAVLYRTLAAAYAEAVRFREAVQAGERAVALARSSGASQEQAACARQLERYRTGKPLHFGE
jgi:protein O-mannosyl-transferase